MWARAAGAALAFINAIVITPLDKLGAHPFAADRSTQSELVTPFGEVGLAENVSVICSPPNEHLWARWNGIPLPINEGHGAGHLNRVARLGGLGTEKERHPVISIGEIGSIGMNWSIRATPIDTDSHVFDWRCPAVFPARLGREPRDKSPGSFLYGSGKISFSTTLLSAAVVNSILNPSRKTKARSVLSKASFAMATESPVNSICFSPARQRLLVASHKPMVEIARTIVNAPTTLLS